MALTTFSDLVTEARARVRRDAIAAGLPDDGRPLRDGGTGATAYSEAVGVYLAFAQSVTAVADRNANPAFGRQKVGKSAAQAFGTASALPMVWDYAEGLNPFSAAGGTFTAPLILAWCDRGIDKYARNLPLCSIGCRRTKQMRRHVRCMSSYQSGFSTDPPYYDNIGYADLSDFFYVWLRRSLKPLFPDLFATLAVPKAEELVADARTATGARTPPKPFSSPA